MDINTIVSSVLTGLFTSFIASCLFYRLGRRDTESVARRVILTLVDMRLRQMDPTLRKNIPQQYDLRDTEHWLTCLCEVLAEIGFRKDSSGLQTMLEEIRKSPDITEPGEQQRAEGETKKKKWEADLHKMMGKI